MDDVVEFDGFDRPRKLRVDINAISEFEEATGLSIFDVVTNADRLSLSKIRSLLWAMMRGDDRKLTRERVGQLMNDYIIAHDGEFQSLADALVEAVNKSRLVSALTVKSPKANGEDRTATTAASPTSENGSASD